MNTVSALLILHGLFGVALLGAITHQAVSMLTRRTHRNGTFVARYTRVSQGTFTLPVVGLFLASVLVGAIVYPAYRLNVRIPFEEMALGWAVGVFELKEHFAGVGLCVLPLYVVAWRKSSPADPGRDRAGLTLLLAFIVWWDFLVGHVLNNIRGLA